MGKSLGQIHKSGSVKAWETVPSAAHLQLKPENLGLNPRHPWKKPGRLVLGFNPNTEEVETGGYPGPASLAKLISSRFSEITCLRRLRPVK